jgi:hypothetical protein
MGAGKYSLMTIIALALWPTLVRAEAAIAFSQEPNGGWQLGTAYNYKTGMEAENAALNNCQKRGTKCTPVEHFNNSCVAFAVQIGNNGWATRYGSQDQAQRDALKACARMGLRCQIQASFCDSIKEVVETLICTRPVFTEEYRLKQTILDNPNAVGESTAAISYLRQKYCRTIEEKPDQDQSEPVGENVNCQQFSGIYRGERVYWGECNE